MTERKSEDSSDIDTLDHIRDVVERAMEGAATGDLTKLRSAFHSDARMFGEAEGERHDAPISDFFELCEKHPLRKDKSYRWRLASIMRVGDGAMAMVTEDGCWGSAAFVDFFTITQLDGSWKITNKTFAYTGGGIPDEVTR